MRLFCAASSAFLALSLCAGSLAPAQEHPANRAFALVSGSSLNLFGSYPEEDSPFAVYAHAHPGHYLLFWKQGELYRLDSHEQIAETERLYASMAPLEARQKELNAQQKPYEEQQRVLETRQRAAAGNPAEQGRIGQEQGRIGQLQGELGRQQGEVGRKQGEIGRALYARAVALIDGCTANHTCKPVAATSPSR